MKLHYYNLDLRWAGNTGEGTENYRSYQRQYEISATGKPVINGSSDPSFSGDATKYNPEELLLASIAGCHMLWYLHLCSEAGIVVTSYSDLPTAVMKEKSNGSGYFESVILHPNVVVQEDAMIHDANALHTKANEMCFIANSLNFKIHHQPVCSSIHVA